MLDLKTLIIDIGDRLDSSRYCPDHWHDVVLKKGRIKVDVTPGCGKKTRVIYVFRNKEDGYLLVGKTDTLARERLNKYAWTFNTNRSEGQKRFPTAVRNNPKKFEWAILYECKRDDDLELWEVAFIIALNTIAKGYNQQLGSGSSAVPKAKKSKIKDGIPVPAAATPPPSPVKTAAELIAQSRIYDFYKDEEGFFRADWTPNAKKVGSKIYGILLEDDLIYTGKSDQELRKRVYKHFADSRSTTEKADLPLYQALAKAKEGAVLLIENNVNSPERKEGVIRKAFEDAGYRIANVAGTGGGGAGKGRTKRAREESDAGNPTVKRALFQENKPPTAP